MNNLSRLAVIGLVTIFLSACAGKKVELNRTVFESQKIEVVRIDQMESTISAEKSNQAKKVGLIGGVAGVLIGSVVDNNTNAARAKSLTPLADALSNYDVNQQISDALAKHLTGSAFAEQINFDTNFDPKDKVKPYLVPRVTPSVVMAADYSGFTVTLNVVTYQNKEGKKPHKGEYIAEHLLDAQGEEVTKEDNFQFWLDNPDNLIESITKKIDEAVAAFATDFNS